MLKLYLSLFLTKKEIVWSNCRKTIYALVPSGAETPLVQAQKSTHHTKGGCLPFSKGPIKSSVAVLTPWQRGAKKEEEVADEAVQSPRTSTQQAPTSTSIYPAIEHSTCSNFVREMPAYLWMTCQINVLIRVFSVEDCTLFWQVCLAFNCHIPFRYFKIAT